MTRRHLLALWSALARFGGAQEYRTYSQCLPGYLKAKALEAYKRRSEALRQIDTLEALQGRRIWARETFWRLIGGQPPRSDLRTRTVGGFDRPGYRLEKLVYESQPGLHVTANLYLPTSGKPPYPGVLFQAGHSTIGKAADPYQRCCQGLARLGYAVLAFDPMGQGERTYYPKPNGTLTRLPSADEEHSRPGRQMLLVGHTATRLQTWDAVRSLDVLASHPMVDPKRLASTGNSGGGTLTMFLAAVDDRLAAAAVSCGNTENFAAADFNPPGSVDDAEQNFVNSGTVGFDRWDTLYPLAPKPLLITVSARDFFGTYSPSYLASGREEFERLRTFYALAGGEDRIRWYESPLPHGLAPNMRVQIYNFFEQWLRGSKAVVAEPAVEPETPETLWVGKTGNAVRDFVSNTPLELARAHRPVPSGGAPRVVAPPANLRKLGSTAFGGVRIEVLETQTAPGVFVPMYLFLPPATVNSGGLLFALEPRGRNAHWAENGMWHQLAKAGTAVCAFDVRGIGDLSPEVGRGNPYYTRPHSEEEAYAWASLILGEPLLLQRAVDTVGVVQSVSSYERVKGRRSTLAALGAMTVPALFAAVDAPAITRVYLAGGLPSYAGLLTAEDYKEPFANFLPGVLEHTDLPALRTRLGNRLQQGTEWSFEVLSQVARTP